MAIKSMNANVKSTFFVDYKITVKVKESYTAYGIKCHIVYIGSKLVA